MISQAKISLFLPDLLGCTFDCYGNKIQPNIFAIQFNRHQSLCIKGEGGGRQGEGKEGVPHAKRNFSNNDKHQIRQFKSPKLT